MDSLDFFFYPKEIAIIGASKEKTKGGNIILNNVKKGFKGEIYPVNPKYNEIEGFKCYSISELPEGLDLAIVFVPAKVVVDVILELVKKRVKGVIIESGGFAESGEFGEKLQKQLLEIRKQSGIRIWGPNCMGIVDMHARYVFSFVSPTIWDFIYPGDISLIVQSGMLSAGFLIDTCSSGPFGIAKACSIGNKLDVDECDLLEYLLNDPETKVIGMYLESIKQGKKFLNLVKNAQKPIVVLKGGKTKQGAKAALTHTASYAGSYEVISGIFEQANVVEANDFKEMMDQCLGFSFMDEYHLKGSKVAVITYSGGAGIVSADLFKDKSIELANLSNDTIKKIKSFAPEWLPISNPADVWPAVEKNGPSAYVHIFKEICKDDGVDFIFLHVFSVGQLGGVDLKQIKNISRRLNKPVFLWGSGDRESKYKLFELCRELRLPIFQEISRAVEVMDKVVRFYKKEEPQVDINLLNDKPLPINCPLPSKKEILDEYESKSFLRSLGIPTVEEYLVASEKEAIFYAEKMGYPVVLKGILPGLIHKTEHGLVRTNLHTEGLLRAAYQELNKKISDNGTILIQKQLEIGYELIAGLSRDKNFGPVVMLGFGGIFAEILKDKIFRVAPFSLKEAYLFTYDLKNQKILEGYRKYPEINRLDLAKIIKILGELGQRFDEIESLDLNPLIVNSNGIFCVDATITRKT
ncbi:acetate--CoA ligase family protein [Desulfothermus sp.]